MWPRQIGKDTSCWALMLREAVKVPGNYFYLFPTSTDAKRALWEKIMDDGTKLLHLLPIEQEIKIGNKDLVKRINNIEMVLELYNGSTIRVLGTDSDENAIRGVSPQGVVFSEFAFAKFEVYKAIQPALDKRNCWQIINSTPNGRNHFYDIYTGVRTDKNWWTSKYQALYPDQPRYIHIHDKEHFEGLVNTGISTWEDLEREYGCSFEVGLKGSFYADSIELARETGRIGTYLYNSFYPVNTGWDVGIDDDTVVWFYQIIGNATIFIDYHVWDKAEGAAGYVSFLAGKQYKYGEHNLPHDAANRRVGPHRVVSTSDLLDEAARNISGMTGTFQTVEKPGNKQHAIDLVRSQFPLYCFDVENCKRGLKHLEHYHRRYDRVKKVFTKDPVHDKHSHSADALQTCALACVYADTAYYDVNNLEGMEDFDVFA